MLRWEAHSRERKVAPQLAGQSKPSNHYVLGVSLHRTYKLFTYGSQCYVRIVAGVLPTQNTFVLAFVLEPDV